MAHDIRRAAATRDVALGRLRRLTVAAAGAGIALTAAFAGLAAGSTHLTKVVRRVQPRTATRPAKQTPVTAPMPPLVSAHEAAPAPTQSAAPAQAPQAVPQAPQPVVVSGGS